MTIFPTPTRDKQNNYQHAYPSLLIACHGRCAKNVLRCKSVVCPNQLGANLQFTLRIKLTSNVENMNFGPRFSIRNTGWFNSGQRVNFKLKLEG